MNKIALIIFPIHASHGCLLQTYALKCKLEDLGFSVDIFNRHWNKPSLLYRLIYPFYRLLFNIRYGINLPLCWEDPCGSFKLKELNSFINEFLLSQVIEIKSNSDFSEINWNNYHAIIVGSDQTWRPKYVPDIFNYYLDFAERYSHPLKISYAASFGTSQWEYSVDETNIAKRLLSYFNSVSVRENSGVDLCSKYLNKNAVQVLDPTLLFNGIDYIKRLNLKKQMLGHVAAYFLDRTQQKIDIADYIAKRNNSIVLNVNRRIECRFAPAKQQIAPSIAEWLESMIAAKYVIVDSFHAMVFSILFHKQFLVIGNPERGLSRFITVLDSLGLLEKLYNDKSDPFVLINSPINWNDVDNKLEKQRCISLEYLSNSLFTTR